MKIMNNPLLLAMLLTGTFSISAQPVPGTVLWTNNVGATISSSPAIAPDGAICFGTAFGITAITNSGMAASNKWTFPVGQLVSSSPAIALDGTVYFLNPGNGCYALNPDGSMKWSYPFQSTGLSSPAIGSDGTIYVVGNNSLYALTSSGAMKWAYNISSQDGAPVIGVDGTVYLANGSSLFAIHPDGTQKWAIVGSGSTSGEAATIAADGTIYTTRGVLAAYTPDGTFLWQTANTSFDTSSPIIARDGTIYVVDNPTRNLYAISSGGQVAWTAAVGTGVRIGALTVPAIDTGGNIYYCASNSVLALSSQGQLQWVVGLSGPPQPGGSASITSPVIGPDGTIYAALDSTLYAIAGTNVLGSTPWPMWRQNPRHTGKVEKPVLVQPQKRSDANFQFQLYPQELGLTYSIEISTNLNTWTSLTSIVATTLPTAVADLTATNAPLRFYRASSSQ